MDSVVARESKASKVGKIIVLLVAFVGGPRAIHRRYLDVMVLVHRFGKPDIFIAMTCNPK